MAQDISRPHANGRIAAQSLSIDIIQRGATESFAHSREVKRCQRFEVELVIDETFARSDVLLHKIERFRIFYVLFILLRLIFV